MLYFFVMVVGIPTGGAQRRDPPPLAAEEVAFRTNRGRMIGGEAGSVVGEANGTDGNILITNQRFCKCADAMKREKSMSNWYETFDSDAPTHPCLRYGCAG